MFIIRLLVCFYWNDKRNEKQEVKGKDWAHNCFFFYTSMKKTQFHSNDCYKKATLESVQIGEIKEKKYVVCLFTVIFLLIVEILEMSVRRVSTVFLFFFVCTQQYNFDTIFFVIKKAKQRYIAGNPRSKA